MEGQIYPSDALLILTAAILFYAAVIDLKHYRIRNELILTLVVLFFVHSVLSGRWPSIPWNIAIALLVLIVSVYVYSLNLMGGGDVKLLTAAFLWAGIDCALALSILLLAFATVHTISAKLGWVEVQRTGKDKRPRIPFAPSVAGALIGLFALGCLAPTH
jgi:Flp pilus assembly protein protease CpaA